MNKQEYPNGIPECAPDALPSSPPLATRHALLTTLPLVTRGRCGSDALRFGLLAHTGQGKDINLDVARVAAYSNFCNKLWNATRFAFMYIGKSESGATFTPGALPVSLSLHNGSGGPRTDLHSLPDAWILSRLAETVTLVDEQLKEYKIADAAETLYAFWYKVAATPTTLPVVARGMPSSLYFPWRHMACPPHPTSRGGTRHALLVPLP